MAAFLCVPLVVAQHDGGATVSSNQHAARPKLHIRSRSSRETLKVPPGLSARLFASQLGDISAMALDEDGTIYVSDQARGRVYKLSDRARDGKLDSTRIIWRDFHYPSGLAVGRQMLYVADENAVWVTPLTGGGKTQLASLKNANALTTPRPLLLSGTNKTLFLGLSSEDGPGRVISIATDSGQASLVAGGAGGVSALARAKEDQIWVGSGRHAVPVTGGAFDYTRGVQIAEGNQITGLVLPGQFTYQHDALTPYQDHILAAQGGDLQWQTPAQAGLNVLAVPTRFGRVTQGSTVFADGFAARSGRSAWGQPGAMVMDQRGLFIADRWSGSIWLISGEILKVEPVSVAREIKPDEGDAEPPEEKDSNAANPQGSLILKGSMIEKGTLLEQGSTIPEDGDKNENDTAKIKDKKKRSAQDAPPNE